MTDNTSPIAPLLDALAAARADTGDVATALATVTADTTAAGTLVRFDGEVAASSRRYLRTCEPMPRLGNRVVMLRVGSTWVVTGVVQTSTTRVLGRAYGWVAASIGYVGPGGAAQVWRTTNQQIPNGTTLAHVRMNGTGRSGANAAATFKLVANVNDAAETELDSQYLHNLTDAIANLSPVLSAFIDIGPQDSNIDLRTDVYADAGGDGYTAKYCGWHIDFLR